MKSHLGPSVELSAIVIRACSVCQGKRELGKPCDTCGNKRPAEVTDLGVIASNTKPLWKKLKWKFWGYYAAQHRIRRTNKEMLKNGRR